MKLIIAGSRNIKPVMEPYEIFKQFGVDTDEVDEFVNGGCPTGVDMWCNDWFRSTVFYADWDAHGKAAGPIRNRKMAEYADALLLIWDGTSKGSKNMLTEMRKLKKPVYEVILRTYEDGREFWASEDDGE